MARQGKLGCCLLVPLRSFRLAAVLYLFTHRHSTTSLIPLTPPTHFPFLGVLTRCANSTNQGAALPALQKAPSSLDALIGLIFTAARRLQFRWPSRWETGRLLGARWSRPCTAKRLICTARTSLLHALHRNCRRVCRHRPIYFKGSLEPSKEAACRIGSSPESPSPRC